VTTTWISGIITRDLDALRRELASYPDESDLWRILPGISNSAGTLTLHLAGNLQHFFGAVLGGSGYVRNREAEFQRRAVPRHELLAQVDAAAEAVRIGLSRITDADLSRDYPTIVAGTRLLTGDFLIHCAAHLTYHLGQIDYHRRMVTGQPGRIRALAIPELPSARPAG
jgi:uncharacterized damage-inducible protein DinB